MAAGVSPTVSTSLLFIGILLLLQPCQSRLYTLNDDIALLDNSTIVDVIYDSPVAWIVEFYSSWCGHCQAFAPTWKKIAQVARDWQSVIRVAALDCAEERNLKICRHFGIDLYPTIKFFNASTWDRKDLGKDFKNGDKTFLNILHEMVKVVEQQTHLQNPKPDFQPASEKYIRNFRNGNSNVRATDVLVLVFEQSTSFIGREVVLDMLKYPTIRVKRVLDHQTSLVRKYGVRQYPSVILLDKAGHYRELSRFQRTHADFKRSLHGLDHPVRHIPAPRAVRHALHHYASIHGHSLESKKHIGSSSEVYMVDMVSGLAFMMWVEVPNKKEINGKAYDALRNFVGMVGECFPGKSTLRMFFTRMYTWLSSRLHANSIRSVDLLEHAYNINRIEQPRKSFLTKRHKWHACQGSKPHYRGYPCSLWTLFHTLTVHCGRRDIGTGTRSLLYIRDYIEHFFGCSYCVKHFLEMAKDVEREVHSHDDAIWWLWQGHNRANKRLHGDVSEDPTHLKIQFPSDEACSECREKNGTWNKPVVIQFLKNHYGLDNIRIKPPANVPAELEDADLVRKPHFLTNVFTLGLTKYDTSLCLVVYTAIALALIAMYVYFIRRRRRRPYKYHIHTP